MEPRNLDFWQQHSLRFLEMALRHDKREALANPDGYAKRSRQCGDTVEIFLIIRNQHILHAAFETDGCLYSVACANTVVHLAEGMSLQEAWEITPAAVVDYLETLPEEEFHCAQLAVQTLHLALAEAREIDRNPWKKFYPRQ